MYKNFIQSTTLEEINLLLNYNLYKLIKDYCSNHEFYFLRSPPRINVIP